DEAERSPPFELSAEARAAIRRDFDDPVLAEQAIAYAEGLASGRIAPAPEAPAADPRAGGEARQRRRGLARACPRRAAAPPPSRQRRIPSLQHPARVIGTRTMAQTRPTAL